MNTATLGYALTSGLLAAANPCAYVLLPGFVALVVADRSVQSNRRSVLPRTLLASLVVAGGFFAAFLGYVVFAAPFFTGKHDLLPYVALAIGGLIVLTALWLTFAKRLGPLRPEAPSWRRLAFYGGYGVAYGIASVSSAIGPLLAITGGTFGTGSIGTGLLALLAYLFGLGLLILTAGAGAALLAVLCGDRFARVLRRIGGVLVIPVGLFVAHFGYFELRLYDGAVRYHDRLVDASAQVQYRLVSLIDRLGAPILGALFLVLVVAGFWLRRLRWQAAGHGADL
ncbi:cytochrome c biogenesis protein CcdA [Tamaricihabitans halophyticus]|uniref:Cytochrome c biogenesis protein CcdA n=1 Tax=Tamaricihabitans halophyticus TaxID=1262583 RepID=A0A4R2Q538_9PSEU|nr:hypothetical protein [Tamaricihabitans halophyticus]TCP43882.1 cytochrome c biogenesis protein CcdA [Tamaricihabitans halophyticus]